jgi:hypothetical protein
MKVTRVAFLLTAAFVASAGCGGDGSGDEDKTFEGDGYSFTYPGNWDEGEVEARAQSGNTVSSVAFGPSRDSLVNVEVYRLDVAITEENIDEATDELADVIAQTFEQAGGGVTAGPTRTTVDGLPALRFEASALTPDDERVQSRGTLVFDGSTEYYVNCQFTPDRAEEMNSGCDQVLNSFDVE